jgi:hypothetical protein
LLLNGDRDRGVPVVLAVEPFALTIEEELDGLRPIVALLLILAFGLKLDGEGERVEWDFKGEPGLELEAAL